jgi:hypothetical protein
VTSNETFKKLNTAKTVAHTHSHEKWQWELSTKKSKNQWDIYHPLCRIFFPKVILFIPVCERGRLPLSSFLLPGKANSKNLTAHENNSYKVFCIDRTAGRYIIGRVRVVPQVVLFRRVAFRRAHSNTGPQAVFR